ncbi:MAG: PIG-L family deacetylase [Clostridiales bacterium]
MKLNNKKSSIYIPDNQAENIALERTTHMSIAAHQDDTEIMAYHGISECFGNNDKWFFSVIATNGSGSPRNGIYAKFTDEQMQEVRIKEQKKAAYLGEYSALALLNHPSSVVKSQNNVLENDIKELILNARPKILYTHNLADKHDTHVAVSVKVINVLRSIPEKYHPEKIYGCEVWRNLDWINDNEKVIFDTSKQPNIAAALVEIFDSQISGGKRYDLAIMGRRLSNSTYFAHDKIDNSNSLTYAMDLKPLITNKSLSLTDYITEYIDRFKQDVIDKIKKIEAKE